MTTPIRPADRRDPGGTKLRYDVLYHPSYEWWLQLESGRDKPLPYSSYPVVTRSGLTLAQAREFVAGQGVPPEWYTVRPTTKES